MFHISLSTAPGATKDTVIPKCFNSSLKESEIALTANLDPEYALARGVDKKLDVEPIFIILPFVDLSKGINAFVTAINPITFTSIKFLISFIEIATAVIGFLTLLGAGVGLMNIMLVSVNERTREIGLSKSLGATRRTIFMQFLLEAITICVFGGLVGVILGLILGNLIAVFVLDSKFTLAIYWVIGGIVFCTMIGLLAGLFPAYRASKLNPVDALRYE